MISHAVGQQGGPLAVALVHVLVHLLHAVVFQRRAGSFDGQSGVARDARGERRRARRRGSFGRSFSKPRDTDTRASDVWKPAGSETRGTEAGNARGALGRGTYVSEKDFLVFLCRLETAIRAASCEGGRIGEVRAGRSALRTFGKSDIRVDNVERGQKPKFFRAKRSRRRRARGGFDVPARSRGAWRSSTRRSPRRAHPARWW